MYISKCDDWRETEALRRYKLIAPFLDDSDEARRRELRVDKGACISIGEQNPSMGRERDEGEIK